MRGSRLRRSGWPQQQTALARGGEARFAGAWPGVELAYTASGDAVKEALVVSDRSRIQDFAFDLSVPVGYAPVQQPDGSIEVRDGRGNVPLRLSRSTMIDASGIKANTPTELRKTLTGWRLTIVPDRAWLDEPEREWPVVIDPTVSTDAPPALACEIWSDDDGWSTGAFCDQSPSVVRWVDRDTGRVIWDHRALVRFDLTSALPPGAVIEHAMIDLRSDSTPPPPYGAVGEPWNQNLTWQTSNGSTTWAGGPGSPAAAHTGDATGLVRRWQSGEQPNYDIFVASPVETGASFNLDPVLSIQYAETDDSDGALVEAMVESYVYDEPTMTVAEARRRISLQGRLSNIYDELENAIDGADNGAFWIDDNDGGRIKINIRSNEPTPPASKIEDALDVVEDHALEDYVDFISVPHGYDELVAAQDDLVTALDGVVDESGYSARPQIAHNRLLIEKTDALTAPQTAIDDAAAALGVATHMVVVPAASLVTEASAGCGERDIDDDPNATDWHTACDLPFRAGTVMRQMRCTLGLGVRDADDATQRFVATAGHCLPRIPNQGFFSTLPLTPHPERDTLRIGYPRRTWDDDRGYDLGLISVESLDEEVPEISDGSSFGGLVYVTKNPSSNAKEEPNYPIRQVSFAADRKRVCVTGANRNPGNRHTVCGTLVDKGLTPTKFTDNRVRDGLGLVQTCRPNSPRPSQQVVRGFSGGPVFNSRTALGIYVGQKNGGCMFVYHGAKDLERVKSVKVIARNP